MGRFMAELGLTPVARTRLKDSIATASDGPQRIRVVMSFQDDNGNVVEQPLGDTDAGHGSAVRTFITHDDD